MHDADVEPAAWVGCLACYNAGELRGRWVEGFEAAECVPCDEPGHEEWWVFDHEGYGAALRGECSPDMAQSVADELVQLDLSELEAFDLWLTDVSGPVDVDAFREAYWGRYPTREEFAREYADDIGAVVDGAGWPWGCVDWGWAADELEHDMAMVVGTAGVVHVFNPR